MGRLGVGVWLTDRAGVTTYVNSTMTQMLGVPEPELVGLPMRDFLEDVPQMVRGEYVVGAERCDRRIIRREGCLLWLEMTSLPLIDDAGRPAGTISTAIDVTGRKAIEIAARQRPRRLSRRG